MKKLTSKKLKTEYTEIELSEHKKHIVVSISHKSYIDKFKVKQLTSIRGNLNQFEKKAVLIHVYKLVECKLDNKTDNYYFKKQLNIVNYAEVFGSPWN